MPVGYGASTELAGRCSLKDTVSPFPHFLFPISYFLVPGFITTHVRGGWKRSREFHMNRAGIQLTGERMQGQYRRSAVYGQIC